MTRRHSTGACPNEVDDELMVSLPEGTNNSFRNSRRHLSRRASADPEDEFRSSRRHLSRRLSAADAQEEDLGKMRRTLKLKTREVLSLPPEDETDDCRSSARFQSSRTNQSQTVNDVAKPKLDRIELFQQCTRPFLEALAHQLENTIFEAGQEIMRQGDIGTNMCLLNFGEVEVIVGDPGTVVATLGSGALFGEMAVISKNAEAAKRTATIKAKSYCHCWTIDRPSLLNLLATYPKDELVISAEANRKLQELIKKGFVKDPALDKKDEFRQPSSTKEGWNRVRGSVKRVSVLARLGMKAPSDERTSYESFARTTSCEDIGRMSHDNDVARNSCATPRRTFEDVARSSYGNTFERVGSLESVGRHSFNPDDESGRGAFDEMLKIDERVLEKSRTLPTQRRTPRGKTLSSDDGSFFRENLFDDDEDSIGRRTTCSGISSKDNKPKFCNTTVAKLLKNRPLQDAEPTSPNSVIITPRSDTFSHSSIESDTRKVPSGWIEPPTSHLPPLTRSNVKRSTKHKQSWNVGETSEVTKARSMAQSFLAKREITPKGCAQEKHISIDMLFDCLPSN